MMSVKSLFAGAAVALPLALSAGMAKAADIVDTAVSAGSFNTLVAAVQAAGLVETLKGEGPFTVFAPTDEAFAALPEGTVENLLKPENKEQLVAILTYHVVPGKVTASEVMGKQVMPRTVEGQSLYINGLPADAVLVGSKETSDSSELASVVSADVMADNGVIHVIDKVLLPPQRPAAPARPLRTPKAQVWEE
jgi:uncharacterized surface protein with fasciclin (FAS1) repeats